SDFSDERTVDGRDLRGGDEVTLQKSWADSNGIHLGDRVRLAAPAGIISLKVVGLFEFAGGLDFGGQGFGSMPIGPARKAFDKPHVWDEVDAVVSGNGQAQVDAVAGRLRQEFGKGVDVSTPQQKGQDVEDQLQALNVVLYFFAGMALFVGGFLIFNSFN